MDLQRTSLATLARDEPHLRSRACGTNRARTQEVQRSAAASVGRSAVESADTTTTLRPQRRLLPEQQSAANVRGVQ